MAKKTQVNTAGVEVEVETDEAAQTEVVEAVDTVGAVTAASSVVDEPVIEASTEGLVALTKGGEVLHVHPSCVTAHNEAGWIAA